MINVVRPRMRDETDYSRRWGALLGALMLGMLVLAGRAVNLQVVDRQFLQHEGHIRHDGLVSVPAHRGRLLDRNGESLAISTPVKSVWVNPKEFVATEKDIKLIGEYLGMSAQDIHERIDASHRGFVYLKRRISPELADQAMALGLPGIYADREFRRYYPVGEVTAHLIGINNLEDDGQEGMELAHNDWLKGVPGKKWIMRDGKGRVIEDLASVRLPVPGKDLMLSIDQRLQYLAYRELKKAVIENKARSGSLVLLDTKNGEVLAMVNQPSFNPNSHTKISGDVSRNRAMTDVFEPGSTIKPFVVACAMELGSVKQSTVFDTSPLHIGPNVVKDVHNYGMLDVAHILQKSSNVGVSKIAINLPSAKFWAFYNNLGFGQPLETGFPGETSGHLSSNHQQWGPFQKATMAFGYGLSTSLLQLGRAYLAIANEGVMPMIGLLKRDKPVESHRIMSAKTANSVRSMLENVVSRDGTALKASIAGFRVAGKTGTVKKIGAHGGYTDNKYLALFAGMAPASDPRLVMIVMIDEPSAGAYYGGAVSAPVFSRVMEGALRLLNIPPDQEEQSPMVATKDGVI
ncbi:MAG: cell division protein [Candidatus Methylumidiphilus alinenensis]|uniref:Peptidoglycan D,D-transpeptidase FtsI n=1 Tax=Candidatus Methylumidiphilus alinenensis TaxID=2202197 RepID=A0A2W4QGT9_9GAMM|nr:MAG: cell division protein [Candidatus Methylumidiphilus alinenensis]